MSQFKQKNHKRAQSGFTLVELIFVLIILAILAAFAVPRFASVQTEARSAVINSVAGSIKAASSLAHAKTLAGGNAGSDSISMDGTSIAMVNHWPAATAAGIGATLQDMANMTGTADAGATPPTYTIASDGASGTCQVVYTESASAGAAPTYVTSVSDTGCAS